MMCLYTNLQVSGCVFSAEFNFTLIVFDLILYIDTYHWNKEITDGNEEVYSVLKFTFCCHIIVHLLAVLQWH